jgi:hypothetical protein
MRHGCEQGSKRSWGVGVQRSWASRRACAPRSTAVVGKTGLIGQAHGAGARARGANG